jgi:hypothetical protein
MDDSGSPEVYPFIAGMGFGTFHIVFGSKRCSGSEAVDFEIRMVYF